MNTILWNREVCTRKPHRCAACGSQIKTGTLTEATGNACDGQFVTCYWCAVCVEFMKTMDPSDLAEGVDLWEEDGYSEFRKAYIMATFNQCHECERFNVKDEYVTVCDECTSVGVIVIAPPSIDAAVSSLDFMTALGASTGSVPINAENVERRLKMRRVLNQVWEAWIQAPNLRLGQLILAATHDNGPLFYIPNDVLVGLLQDFLKDIPSSEDD